MTPCRPISPALLCRWAGLEEISLDSEGHVVQISPRRPHGLLHEQLDPSMGDFHMHLTNSIVKNLLFFLYHFCQHCSEFIASLTTFHSCSCI